MQNSDVGNVKIPEGLESKRRRQCCPRSFAKLFNAVGGSRTNMMNVNIAANQQPK